MKKTYLLIGATFVLSYLNSGFAKDLSDLKPFFKTYCYDCHGSKKQKADLRLDTLHYSIDSEENMEKWKKIVESIDTYDMPPEDEREPSDALREKTTLLIQQSLSHAIQKGLVAEKGKVLRQLNKQQLSNSLRDLLQIDMTFENPTDFYPEHDTNSYFNNTASKMKVTDFQLQKVLEIARESIARAKYPGKEFKAKVLEYDFGEHEPIHDFRYGIILGKDYKTLMSGKDVLVFGSEKKPIHPKGVLSTLTIELEGFNNRKNIPDTIKKVYDEATKNAPPTLGVYLHNGRSSEAGRLHFLERFELEEGVRSKISTTFWLPAGYRVYIKSEAGGNERFKTEGFYRSVHNRKKSFKIWSTKNYLQSLKTISGGSKKGPEVIKAFHKAFKPVADFLNNLNKEYDLPRINLYRATLERGTYEEWPPQSHSALFNENIKPEVRLEAFATKAFRRPLRKGELLHYSKLLGANGEGFEKALIAVILSPSFLYLEENHGKLNDFEIASRLSYAIWGSIPDQELMETANKGKLKDKKQLAEQIGRMIKNPKSKSIFDDFVYQWFHLANIDLMPPDRSLYNIYVSRKMQEDTLVETKMYFNHILQNNLPVSHFIKSDYSFINSNLAYLYGDKDFKGSLKHKLTNVSHLKHRGGLLGQSSILTATANGVDTSPINRGVWVLENLFGVTPPPPPPSVDAIPDARGAESIKDLLKKHRNDMTCSRCHSKIDPLGFSLENFDAVGQWRDMYDEEKEVDSSGRYAGENFKDVGDLKKYLNSKPEIMAETILKKFLTYATGRELNASDKLVINELIKENESNNFKLKDLLVSAMTSKVFLER